MPSICQCLRYKDFKDEHPKIYNYIANMACFLLGQWFFIVLACLVAISHSYPQFACHGGMIKAEYSIGYGAVIVIFLLSGLSTETKDLMVNLSNWRAHFTVLTASFLITSSICYGVLTGIYKCRNPKIDDWMLVGLMVTACCPTTVASNVIMTKNANGNDLLSLCEVFIGNILGAFVTPSLVQMYFGTNTVWSFANPAKYMNGTVGRIYANVIKQISLSVFAPLIVGQVIRYFYRDYCVVFNLKTKNFKIGSMMLLLIMFESFSTAFEQNSFISVPKESIIFICFFNFGMYLFFTMICLIFSRPPLFMIMTNYDKNKRSGKSTTMKTFISKFYYSKKDTVAIMLCGPAKTAALGVSLVSAQYGDDNPNLGKLLIPLVLYQSEQVLCAGLLVQLFKKWIGNEGKEADQNKCLTNSLHDSFQTEEIQSDPTQQN